MNKKEAERYVLEQERLFSTRQKLPYHRLVNTVKDAKSGEERLRSMYVQDMKNGEVILSIFVNSDMPAEEVINTASRISHVANVSYFMKKGSNNE